MIFLLIRLIKKRRKNKSIIFSLVRVVVALHVVGRRHGLVRGGFHHGCRGSFASRLSTATATIAKMPQQKKNNYNRCDTNENLFFLFHFVLFINSWQYFLQWIQKRKKKKKGKNA
jgi:hypothetical protein